MSIRSIRGTIAVPDAGPYSVDPRQVAGLEGSAFADVVGRVIGAELARAGMAGFTLTQTYRTNAGDGGIDAGLGSAKATSWIPEGDSAWQFKAGDLVPSACFSELNGAGAALEVLRNGGSYFLVLGKSLTPTQIANRQAKLVEAAEANGIHVGPDAIHVLNGDSLARWIEEFPAVACSPSIGGMGHVGQTFDEWSASISHGTTWVNSKARAMQIDDLRQAIETGEEAGVHVEGVSGLGKTRMVMEALRGQPYESLVLYVPSEDQFPAPVLNFLQVQGRTAVLVVDECDAKRHDVLAAQLQAGSKIRLVTISEPSPRTTRAMTLPISAFDDEPLAQLLELNVPTLWPEATRVIVEMSAGNIDYALKCAKALVAQRPGSAGELVDPADIQQFIVDELPGGALFLASCALALFSRVGFDSDLASELNAVSTALNVPESDLRAAAAALASKGLLTRQGRYRSVGPSPVAIYLASNAWREFGSRIISDLIPALTPDLVERLFARAVEIGDASLPREVVDQMLGGEGPLNSLETVGRDGQGNLLNHLAILSPRRVSRRISGLIAESTEEQLQSARGARRPLIYALEKLAWHTFTFEEAADSLLRLALAENETYANNSTGVWVALFGTMLPSTAASPETRLAYLQNKVGTSDARVRKLVVGAGVRALDSHETTMVSGELQGGVLVEPRGRPKTCGDVWSYKNGLIDLIRLLVDDSDEAVSTAALEALTGAIHASLSDGQIRTHLTSVLATLSASQLQHVRSELADLGSLYDRTDDEHEHAAHIAEIVQALPDESDLDKVWVLTHASPWDRRHREIEEELLALLGRRTPEEATAILLNALSNGVPTDFNIGGAIARIGVADDAVERHLASMIDGINSRAFLGYLLAKEEMSPGAYDHFIDAMEADTTVKLRLSAQGPRTTRATERISEILPAISVADGARAVFYWIRDTDDQQLLLSQIREWTQRVETQADYNALVDIFAFVIHGQESSPLVLWV